MPIVNSINLKGGKELEDMMIELGQTLGTIRKARTVYGKGMKRSLVPMKNSIKSLTPVDSGISKKSVKIQIKGPTRKELRRFRNAVLIGRVGWILPKSATREQAIALFVIEYGKDGRVGLRILRNTANKYAEALFATFREIIIEEVNKAVAKFNAKAKT